MKAQILVIIGGQFRSFTIDLPAEDVPLDKLFKMIEAKVREQFPKEGPPSRRD